jgi:PAS domain S-box-containing protein
MQPQMAGGAIDAITLNAGLLNALPDGILVADRNGKIVFASEQLETLSGYRADELVGKGVEDLVPQRYRRAHVEHRAGYFSAGTPIRTMGSRLRIHLLHKDGREIPVDIALAPIAAEGDPLAMAAVRDVTERTRAQDRLVAVTEVGQAILAGEDPEQLLALVCRRAREQLEAATAVIATREPVSGDLEIAVVDGTGSDSLRRVRVEAEREPAGLASFESALRAAGLGPAVAVPLLAGGRPLGILGLANPPGGEPFTADDRQVIELFAAQAAVAIEYGRARDELRRLDVMEERERIGRELHDGVIQALFAVGMNLQATALSAGRPDLQERIDASVEEIDGAIRDLRNYIFGLRPGILADRQLEQAIQQLAAEVARESGVTIVADIDAHTAAALASVAGDVIQLVRESLSNVARHARASTCRVSLRTEGGRAVLAIDDDGAGFDPAAIRSDGMGLRNLRERAQSMGVELEVASRAGEGTTVTIRLPI